uniref:Uncharacterized protein n=1 Tax=Steinernema glaseri TaxID=37863 RepID=A0A1I7ZG14_9BILA
MVTPSSLTWRVDPYLCANVRKGQTSALLRRQIVWRKLAASSSSSSNLIWWGFVAPPVPHQEPSSIIVNSSPTTSTTRLQPTNRTLSRPATLISSASSETALESQILVRPAVVSSWVALAVTNNTDENREMNW